jgi:hypothetical protein
LGFFRGIYIICIACYLISNAFQNIRPRGYRLCF